MEDNKKKYNFSVIAFDAHKPPKMVEKKNKNYVIFGDDKEYFNNYPQYLMDNYNQSSTHNAICNGVINYISGRGLEVKKYNTVQDLAEAKMLIRKVNEWEDADDLTRKLATDLKIFGGFYVEVAKSKSGDVAGYYHLNFASLRKSKDEEGVWFYTENWEGDKKGKPELNEDFKTFHEFTGEFEAGKEYLLEYRIYKAGDQPYALPDYMAANASIELEWRMQNYHLQSLKNGFNAQYLINFYNGRPTEDEQREIERAIEEKFNGDDNAGSFVLNFNDADGKSAEIIPIPSNGNEDRFNLLKQSVQDSLFIAHNVTSPMLFGVRVAGTLGGKNELIEAAELFQTSHVDNRQAIIEKFWADALYFKGIEAELEIKKTNTFVEEEVNDVAVALGSLSPLVATKILENMSQEEIRGLIGLKGGNIETEGEGKQFTSDLADKAADALENALIADTEKNLN